MKYVSTRGLAPVLGFEDVMLAGLARDGGLYVPETWPTFEENEIAALAGQSYIEVAQRVMVPFLGDEISQPEFRNILEEAYEGFSHKAVAPLTQIGANDWVLELFHGPTLAFKDFAMQVLGQLMDRALTTKKRNMRATIVGATSGDTGGAAIEAFRGSSAIDIFILHPRGRVSDVQRRQMTTAPEQNVHNIAVEGTFDDCQALVKALFNDLELRDRLSLAGVNSINWARIMAQIVYYFTSALSLGAPNRQVSFTVPTGNFGDIFAGYVAKRMGLPISRLVIATNVNDILARTFSKGRYAPESVVATQSPSMDIQVSSNFERLLFELTGRNSERVRNLMRALGDDGSFDLSTSELSSFRETFSAYMVDENKTAEMIRNLYNKNGYLVDPHTAVGIQAAFKENEQTGAEKRVKCPMVTLATAHPAKFPEAVEKATGCMPVLPQRLEKRLAQNERFTVLENDYNIVARFIEENTQASRETAS